MDNELKDILTNIQGELNSIKKELADNREEIKVINYKLDRHSERFNSLDLKVDNLDLKLRNTEVNIRKDIKKLSDDNETMIEVLRQHEFLPN
ncbi:hypothetical protein [Anaerocolumna sp. MB42-C2]|uniref:hypothetical protein n=1 Tax=Anaerocolumna sp. MB42-C2 TaxID=3070997 RepID=UPI0027DFAE5B|nr:hypothetical protein [Anaerocolumna sp. MB42-C2]WMJ88204.1 hypothetical protein RBU59_01475 [Anaerocolumna sp. MB42-C2]